jgi:hypothetical protein
MLAVPNYDRGGWLPPGPFVGYNGTGGPEPVGPTAARVYGGGGTTVIEVAPGQFGNLLFQFLKDNIRTKHGGNVIVALGTATR